MKKYKDKIIWFHLYYCDIACTGQICKFKYGQSYYVSDTDCTKKCPINIQYPSCKLHCNEEFSIIDTIVEQCMYIFDIGIEL